MSYARVCVCTRINIFSQRGMRFIYNPKDRIRGRKLFPFFIVGKKRDCIVHRYRSTRAVSLRSPDKISWETSRRHTRGIFNNTESTTTLPIALIKSAAGQRTTRPTVNYFRHECSDCYNRVQPRQLVLAGTSRRITPGVAEYLSSRVTRPLAFSHRFLRRGDQRIAQWRRLSLTKPRPFHKERARSERGVLHPTHGSQTLSSIRIESYRE